MAAYQPMIRMLKLTLSSNEIMTPRSNALWKICSKGLKNITHALFHPIRNQLIFYLVIDLIVKIFSKFTVTSTLKTKYKREVIFDWCKTFDQPMKMWALFLVYVRSY